MRDSANNNKQVIKKILANLHQYLIIKPYSGQEKTRKFRDNRAINNPIHSSSIAIIVFEMNFFRELNIIFDGK